MKRIGLCQPLVLATVLALGFALAWGLVSDRLVLSWLEPSMQRPAESLQFLPDGTPRVWRAEPDNPFASRDLEGNPLPVQTVAERAALHETALPRAAANPAPYWSRRICVYSDGRWPTTYWYFISDGRPNGNGYFVGYDSQNNQRVGYLGTAGLRSSPLPAAELFPFGSAIQSGLLCFQQWRSSTEYLRPGPKAKAPAGGVSDWDVYVLGHDGCVRHVDLQARTVKSIFQSADIRSMGMVWVPSGAGHGFLLHLAIRSGDQVSVLDGRDQVLRRYRLPEEARTHNIHFVQTTAGTAAVYWASPPDSLASHRDYEVYWLGPDGIQRHIQTQLGFSGNQRFGIGVALPCPLLLAGFLGNDRASELVRYGMEPGLAAALLRTGREFALDFALVQLIAVILAVFCYRRQVRYGASRWQCFVWTGFVLLLGLPGWIGYRFGRSWPVLESCPACQAPAPQDRIVCIRCTTEFPTAARRGTEVFA